MLQGCTLSVSGCHSPGGIQVQRARIVWSEMAQKVLWLEVGEELFEEALVLRLEGPRSQEGSSEEGVEVEADLACRWERAFFCSPPCQCHFLEDLYHLKYVLPYQDFLYWHTGNPPRTQWV